ncbi:MAG: glycosyltransferase family 4 protein, partial [Solirubrobacteraceae bacterium]
TDRGSLPELAGDAALPIDPGLPESIAAAIETLLTDEAERDRRRAAGHVQAARFSWAATARGTAAAYACALAGIQG